MTKPLSLCAACALWLYAVPVLVATLLVDLLAWPWVLTQRRRTTATTKPTPSPAPPTQERRAAILILNWNGVDFLRALLPTVRAALDRTPGDHEVLVIDNGSTDDSVAFVERDHPWARIVRLPENRFFIRGNRAGVEAVSPDKDTLVFLNNDMRVEPDFLTALLGRFGPDDLFAATARIDMEGDQVETGRTRFFYKRGALRQEQLPCDQGAAPEPALWAGGGSTAFDRAKYETLGGFEDLYEPCYMEDVSLSYAAWRRGWRVEFVPSAVVHHVHRGTSAKVFSSRGVDRLDRRNRELFFWRSVTDPTWLLSHAFHMPWNAYKDLRRIGLRDQFAAIIGSVPRLPAAWRARQNSRVHASRTDRDVLTAAQ